MKLAAGSAMLGMLLSGSVLAQNSGADPVRASIHDKVAAAQADRLAGEKAAKVQQGKAKLTAKPSGAKSGAAGVPAAEGRKTEGAEIPDDAAEQSVQIKGVRG